MNQKNPHILVDQLKKTRLDDEQAELVCRRVLGANWKNELNPNWKTMWDFAVDYLSKPKPPGFHTFNIKDYNIKTAEFGNGHEIWTDASCVLVKVKNAESVPCLKGHTHEI